MDAQKLFNSVDVSALVIYSRLLETQEWSREKETLHFVPPRVNTFAYLFTFFAYLFTSNVIGAAKLSLSVIGANRILVAGKDCGTDEQLASKSKKDL